MSIMKMKIAHDKSLKQDKNSWFVLQRRLF
jgi:hypothetical protein